MRKSTKFNIVAKPAADVKEFFAQAAGGSNAALILSIDMHGKDILEARDERGRTALLCAVDTGHAGAIHLLIKRGADIDARDGDGNSAVMIAALKGFKGVVEMLLARNADIHLTNYSGQGLLQLAATHRNNNDGRHPMSIRKKETIRLLLDRGARIDVTDNKGNTPESWARRFGYRDVAAMISREAENRRRRQAEDLSLFTDGLPENITFNTLRLKRDGGKPPR